MKYEFINRAILVVTENLIIVTTNPLIYYLVVEESYIRLLLMTKLIFISIEFEILEKASCTYDGLAKLERETRPS